MTAPAISDTAIALIIEFEVTSRATYDRLYARPTRPGGMSGVTIGLGYDLGQVTASQFLADWSGVGLPDAVENRLAAACTVKGDAAIPFARNLSDVSIPWDAALAVFRGVSLPAYTRATVAAIPGADHLPPDCLGALVSLAYNRGAGGFTAVTDRYREMRAIRAAIVDGHPEAVPVQLRAMKRLWVQNPDAPQAAWVPMKDLAGLLVRRDREADLFEAGLPKGEAEPTTAPLPAHSAPTSVVVGDDREGRG